MEKRRRGAALFFILCSTTLVMVSWTISAADNHEKYFNHLLHIEAAGESESCGVCHLGEHRTFTGIPVLECCQNCHDASDTEVWEQVENIMKRVNFEKGRRKI